MSIAPLAVIAQHSLRIGSACWTSIGPWRHYATAHALGFAQGALTFLVPIWLRRSLAGHVAEMRSRGGVKP